MCSLTGGQTRGSAGSPEPTGRLGSARTWWASRRGGDSSLQQLRTRAFTRPAFIRLPQVAIIFIFYSHRLAA